MKTIVPVALHVYQKRESSHQSYCHRGMVRTTFSYQSYLLAYAQVVLSDGSVVDARIGNATSLKSAGYEQVRTKSDRVRKFLPKNSEVWLNTGRIDPDTEYVSPVSCATLVKTGFGGHVPFEYWNRDNKEVNAYALGFVMVDGKLYAPKYVLFGKTSVGNDKIYDVKSNGTGAFDTDRWVYSYVMELFPVELPEIDGKKARSLKKEYVSNDGSKYQWSDDEKSWVLNND